MSQKIRIVYIAHPIGGDVEKNLASLRRIVRSINAYEPHTVPFCPYYADVVSLNDNDPAQRARGLQNDMAILSRPGMVDELRLYGETISDGMRQEIETAHIMGINIVCSTPELYKMLSPIIAELDVKYRVNA
ncbi:MAG TPA: hypothetical protein VIQ00_02870 [Chitinophagaceae bacterium]|jgi:hypothetical protein